MENPFREETKKVKKRKKSAKATLSFAMDDDEDDGSASTTPLNDDTKDDPPPKRGKFRKNPNVDTSFLPDREREEQERTERERLRQEWLSKQEQMKQEEIEVTYSYWDGSGHRKSVTVSFRLHMCILTPELMGRFSAYVGQCKKGDDIGSFLEKCRQQFPELRGVNADNLMYVKVGKWFYKVFVCAHSIMVHRKI